MGAKQFELGIGEQFFLGDPAAHEEIFPTHIDYLLVGWIELLDGEDKGRGGGVCQACSICDVQQLVFRGIEGRPKRNQHYILKLV